MATYIPEIPVFVPNIETFQPDFNMQRQVLQVQQARYDRGYNAVQGAYKSVLNAPMSSYENIQARDSFLQSTSEQLAKIAKTDLSLHENVIEAEKIYEPFWNDNDFTQDIAKTKQLQKEYQTGLSFRDSKDEDTRDQYSDIAMEYISGSMEKLRNAKRGDGSISKVETRRFVPFKNVTKHLNTAAKDAGFKIEWESQSGPYLYNEKNGERSLLNFRTFAEGIVGADFDDQFRVMGTVIKEKGIKSVRNKYGDIPEEMALSILAESTISEMKENYTKSLDETTTSLQRVEKDIQALIEKGDLLPADIQRADYLETQKEMLTKKLETDTENVKKFSDKTSAEYLKLHERITTNGDGYYAQLSKQRIVNNWAAAQSANQGRTIKIDDVWKEKNDVAYKQATLRQTQETNDLAREKFEWEKLNPKDKDGNKTVNGKTDKNGDGIADTDQPELEGHYIGLGTTDVTKEGTALEVYNQYTNRLIDNANDRVFDVSGLTSVLRGLPGITEDDLVTYSTYNKRYFKDPTNTRKNADEKVAVKKVYEALAKAVDAPMGPVGPAGQRDLIMQYAATELKKRYQDGGIGVKPEDRKLLSDYVGASRNMQEFNRLQEERKKATEAYITSTGAFKELTKIGEDGKPTIVNKEDIAAMLKPMTLVVGYRPAEFNALNVVKGAFNAIPDIASEAIGTRAPGTITLTPEQLADGIMTGRSTIVKTGGHWAYKDENGKVVEIRAVNFGKGDESGIFGGVGKNGVDLHFSKNMNELSEMMWKVKNRFAPGFNEDIQDIPEKFKKLNEVVVPDLELFKTQTGKMGHSTKYYIDETETKDSPRMGKMLVSEILHPSNSEEICINGRLATDEERGALSILGGQTEIGKFVSSVYHNTHGKNGENLSLTINANALKDSKGEFKSLLGVAAENSQLSIEIPISSNARGEFINRLPKGVDFDIFDQLKRGQTISSDEFINSTNFSYKVIPNNRENPTKAEVIVNRKLFNPKNGKWEPQKPTRQEIPLVGDGAKSPSEIMSELDRFLDQHLVQNQISTEIHKNTAKANGQTITYAQYLEERKKQQAGYSY